MQLPVLQSVVDKRTRAAAAAQAAETTAARCLSEASTSFHGSAQLLSVPAIQAPDRLAPAKLAVYQLFEEQVLLRSI